MKPYKLFEIMKWICVAIFTVVAITIYKSSLACAIMCITTLIAGFSISAEYYERRNYK